jgi:hypothetical protein
VCERAGRLLLIRVSPLHIEGLSDSQWASMARL